MKAAADYVRDWLAEMGLVSISYLICFVLAFGVFFPLQQQLLPSLAANAMLFFFPHGVRIIAAWLYGWRSIMLLFPSALLTQVWLLGLDNLNTATTFGCFVGVSCGAVAFAILAACGRHTERYRTKRRDWLLIITASALASVMNSAGTNWFLNGNITSALAYLVGDVSGTMVLLALLTLANRLVRRLGY